MFRRKYHSDGTLNTYNDILVTKNYRQEKDVDYFDTYVLEASTTKIWVSFPLTSFHGLIVHQMDVKITFLNRDLDEEIYIEQP